MKWSCASQLDRRKEFLATDTYRTQGLQMVLIIISKMKVSKISVPKDDRQKLIYGI